MKYQTIKKGLLPFITLILVCAGTSASANENQQKESFSKKPVGHQMQPASLMQSLHSQERGNERRNEKQALLNKKLPYLAKAA